MKKSQNGKVNEKKGRRKRSWTRWLFRFFILLVIFALIVAGIVWVKRFDILESQARQEFQKADIEASLDFESFNSTNAIIKNVVLSRNGKTFFAADQVVLDYTLEEIRAGIVDKVTVIKPELSLTLDENGTIIDDWVPAPSDGQSQTGFPVDGIIIENGLLKWTAPFGSGEAIVDSTIKNATEWRANIKSESVDYTIADIDTNFGFSGEIIRKNADELNVIGDLNANKLRVRESYFEGLDTDFDLNLSTGNGSDDLSVSGQTKISIGAMVLPVFSGRDLIGDFDFTGILGSDRSDINQFRSTWKVDATELSMTDTALAKRLVHKTIAYDTMSKTPIAMHFGDHFERRAVAFLQKFSFKGQGQYTHDEAGYALELDDNARLKADTQNLVLKPGNAPEIQFNRAQKQLFVDTDVDWLGSRNLFLSGLEIEGVSENGLVLDGVKAVNSRIRSDRIWKFKRTGEEFRLAPLNIKLGYVRNEQRGIVNLAGGIDYDGEIPGGSATGLLAGGRVKIDLVGDRFDLDYSPSRPVTISEFVSTTGWRAENVEMKIENADNILAKTATGRPLLVNAYDVKADIISPEDDRHLTAVFDKMQVKTDFTHVPQKWALDFQGIEMRSEDFPSPGTHIVSPAGIANVYQYADGHIEFDVDSPLTRIETENADIHDLSIQMSGLPNDFSATYHAGRVKLKEAEMPELPMYGVARLAAGKLTGSAEAHLPESTDTAIFIDYDSLDGVGSARISIPSIKFDPDGLQPQYVIPALRGRLAEVRGEASAEFKFAFSGGGPVRSYGSTKLHNLQVGTMVGPLSGVNADLKFNSIFPLQTDGVQSASLSGFDPGFPLNDGTIKFEMVPEGVRISEAIWPVMSIDQQEGRIYIEPLLWRFGDVENRAVVMVENLSLGTIIDGLGNKDLSATGQIFGRLPVSVKGIKVLVENGSLAVKDGGTIRYKSQGIDTFVDDVEASPFLGDGLEGAETGFAFKALENFQYKELEANIDGPLDGEMSIRMAFDGKNPDVLYGTAFSFNVVIEGELANIVRETARAFSSETHVEKLIELQENEQSQVK